MVVIFTPQLDWPIVVPFLHLRRRRPHRRMQPFIYYINMVQQIEFIIHTNIQPLRAIFLPKVKVKGSKNSCYRDNLKNNY